MNARDQLIAIVHPAFSNGDPDPDDLAGVEDVVDAVIAAAGVVMAAALEQAMAPIAALLAANHAPLAIRSIEPEDDEPDGPCPDDPDGMHHVGCGC